MLPLHLQAIKSSGVYRFTFDKSEVSSTAAAQTMRLVVGYSEKGPFNTVLYISTAAQFTEVYGEASKRLEKRGIFFHQLAKQCLSEGPILCLNLKKFDDETVGCISMDPSLVDYTKGVVAIDKEELPVSNIFDRTRLWTLNPETFVNNLSDTYLGEESNKYINITSTDTEKTSCTVVMKPAKVAAQYDVTLGTWFSTYSGGEIPEWAEGFTDTLVSDYFVNVYIFRGEFTSAFRQTTDYIKYFDEDGNFVDYVTNSFGNKVSAIDAFAAEDGSGYLGCYTGSLLPYFADSDGSMLSIDLKVNADNSTHSVMMYLDENMLESSTLKELGLSNSIAAYPEFIENIFNVNTLNKYHVNDVIPNIDIYNIVDGVCEYTAYTESYGGTDLQFINITNENTDNLTNIKVSDAYDELFVVGDTYYGDADNNTVTLLTKETTDGIMDLTFSGDVKLVATTIEDAISAVQLYGNNAGEMVLLVGNDGSDTYPIIDIGSETSSGTDSVSYIVRYNNTILVHGNSTSYNYLKGYVYAGAPTTVANTDVAKRDWIDDTLNIMINDNGLYQALTNDIDVEYRYLVDTFETFVNINVKYQLTSLCKNKGNAFAILNTPSMQKFIDCKYASFTDKGGNFQPSLIATSSAFSLPVDGDGASFAAYYTPLKFLANGVTSVVPSTALVSNLFIAKYTTRQPYYVVAGPKYGRMYYSGLVGPDFNFSREDLDSLEPYGINTMLYKPRLGTYINSNQTAKQVPVTGLSKINVRELVIYLQDAIADMLRDYQWEMNTSSLRAAIKAKADAICTQVQSNEGLYTFLNVCDDTNNTADTIDNEMVVLATHIEPAKGAGKMIHELTIYRTGGMDSIIK